MMESFISFGISIVLLLFFSLLIYSVFFSHWKIELEMNPDNDVPPLVFVYKNYKGEVSTRRVIPERVYFGSNEFHKGDQWLMKAWDLDKDAEREFALADVIEFKLAEETVNVE
jgi:hypothetical protein